MINMKPNSVHTLQPVPIFRWVLLIPILFALQCHSFLYPHPQPGVAVGSHDSFSLLVQSFALGQNRRFRVDFPLMMEVWYDCRYNIHSEDDIQSHLSRLDEEPDVVIVEKVFPLDNVTSKSNIAFWYREGNILKDSKSKETVGAIIALDDASGQEQAMAALGSVQWILIESSSSSTTWQMIPAENLIGAAQSTGTKIAFCVDKASDVAGLARALELGVDSLCISTQFDGLAGNAELWDSVFQARKERKLKSSNERDSGNDNIGDAAQSKTPEIVTGACWRRATKGTILADRICVDLVQSLSPEEGCFVGSSAKIMALILSEAASSQFVPTRPFRVNAGPVHSYILMADGISTKYLCELEPSDQVLVYNAKSGESRGVAVGRLKEELRPCVLVELAMDGEHDSTKHSRGQVFLQQAETVRLGQVGGKFVRVTELESQDGEIDQIHTEPLLLRVISAGTHVGKIYSGKVEER